MGHHVFVAMPFGIKQGIDFDSVYDALIRPALLGHDFTVFRADEEKRAGDIRRDMFQELLLADIVVADLTIDNPNAWYELGVRHALRKRGVILLSAREGASPFDIVTDRKLRYHLKDGVPDAAKLESDRAALAEMARETVAAWHGRVVSPVYSLLPYLQEPNWKTLIVGGSEEFWNLQKEWESRVNVARRKQRPGDILVLAEEAPIQGLRLEAYRTAAKALRRTEQHSFALEQIEHALAVAPDDLESRQEKGILLGRLGRFDQAKQWLESLQHDNPSDAETLGLIGRVEKDEWLACWQRLGYDVDARREAAKDHSGALREAMHAYARGFEQDPASFYCGINAVTLLHLNRHLDGDDEQDDPILCTQMEGGVQWAATAAVARESLENLERKNYFARVTLADLQALIGDIKQIERAYRRAVAVADHDWFSLNATRRQLTLLQELEFRPAEIGAALSVIENAMKRLQAPFRPRRVFLFSGHMIDAPNRPLERFPADMADLAKVAIEETLDALDARQGDLALCQGACGGDLLFARAALDRGLRVELRLPFDEATFLQRSVDVASGESWRERYFEVKNNELTTILVMPDELGPVPKSRDTYERANLWQLYSALAWGPSNVEMIVLWNGKKSGKPGGTDHMLEEVSKRSGQYRVIDSRALLRQTTSRRSRQS
ncbi:protein of unknown function [Paraburkholderia fungorum]|uniref:Uncharacterized protein n=1 Tax=Paraburkholderia fungorum TaxID=134537 RepID=A0A1H1JMU2_9BURK|nr:TRAFs-binding domain-containing protein [Paraburkholderia fungorum]SDR51303.1 protein of unknown function [Paraburkholderia fungorum]